MARQIFDGRKLKGEVRSTRRGDKFFSTKTLKGKGDDAFRIAIDPSPAAIARKLRFLPKRFQDWRPAFEQLVPKMRESIQRTIRAKRGPSSETWATPKPSYAARKAREGFGATQLLYSGQLIRESGEVAGMSKSSVSVGVKNLRQARALNFGFRGPGTKIGARPFIGWTDRLRKQAVEIFNDHTGKMLVEMSKEIEKLTTRGAA